MVPENAMVWQLVSLGSSPAHGAMCVALNRPVGNDWPVGPQNPLDPLPDAAQTGTLGGYPLMPDPVDAFTVSLLRLLPYGHPVISQRID